VSEVVGWTDHYRKPKQRYRISVHPSQNICRQEQILGLVVLEVDHTEKVQNNQYGSNYEQRMNPTAGFRKA
jgi:hypothetical protein